MSRVLRLALLTAASLCFATAVAFAAFSDSTRNPQTVSAAPDFTPPAIARSVIAKSSGGET